MNPKQLEDTLKQLDAKGASKAEIQQVYDAYKQSSAPQPDKPGFGRSVVQDIVKPVASLATTVAGGLVQPFVRAFGSDQNNQNFDAAMRNGIDLPSSLGGGTSRPIDSSFYDPSLSPGQKTIRSIGSGVGSEAELLSYGMAPLNTGAGFWNTVKEAIPLAATFGGAKGAEAIGDGKSLAESAMIGGANAVGAAAGYGLLKGGANFFANWGARALQTPAVQAAGSWMKGFAEKTFTSLPEAFQGAQQSLADLTNSTTRRTVAALKSEFDTNFNTSKDAIIDSLMPSVNTPDLTLGKFQRSLSENMGNKFREANTLYDSVKADQTAIDRFTVAEDALGKAPKVPAVPGVSASPEERRAFLDAAKAGSDTFQNFLGTMKSAVKQPLTLKQIMGLWQDSMGHLTGATPDEKVIIRDFASGLYADARSVLEKKNPELLDQWDTAYQAWKKAGDLYESSPLNALKSVGDVDTFVDTMLNKQMTRPEQDTFVKSLGDSKPAVQDLFINSILRKAKELPPNDGAKLIQKFLDGYGETLLGPQQTKMLDDTAHFMGGSFDEFVLGMRKAQGLTESSASDLLQGQTHLDLLKTVNDGRLDQIATRFTKMADSPELEKTLEAFSPEEKNVIGLSITKGLFDEKLPVAGLNADGSYKISPEFAGTLIDIATKVNENKALQKIMSPEQLKALKSAATFAEKTEDLSQIPAAGYHRIMNGLVSVFYFARGWMPGGVRNAIEAASGAGEKTLLYYSAVDDLISQGLIKPNVSYTIGDLMKLLLPGVGQTTSNATSQLGQ